MLPAHPQNRIFLNHFREAGDWRKPFLVRYRVSLSLQIINVLLSSLNFSICIFIIFAHFRWLQSAKWEQNRSQWISYVLPIPNKMKFQHYYFESLMDIFILKKGKKAFFNNFEIKTLIFYLLKQTRFSNIKYVREYVKVELWWEFIDDI